jgi:hypothetical protein
MIFAERHQRSNPRAKAEFEKLAKEIGAVPSLLRDALTPHASTGSA